MKSYIKCIILICIAINLVACASRDVTKNNIESFQNTNKEEVVGTNTNIKLEKEIKKLKNISNSQMANEDEESYYYVDRDKLIRESKFSGIKEIILEESCKNINILEDRIIVMGSNRLYSIDKNTSRRQVLLEAKCSDVQVIDDWVYFINESENKFIYRMTLDGKVIEQLNDEASGRLVVVNENCIIYCLINEEEELFDNFYTPCGKLYKLSIEDRKIECLTECNVSFVNVVDQWIYYANVDDGMYLYKIKLDGSEEQVITKDHAYYINATLNIIYYSDVSTGIYAVDLEGNKKGFEVLDARYTHLNKVGDRLYYSADGIESRGYIDLISNKQVILDEEDKEISTNGDKSSNVSIEDFTGLAVVKETKNDY